MQPLPISHIKRVKPKNTFFYYQIIFTGNILNFCQTPESVSPPFLCLQGSSFPPVSSFAIVQRRDLWQKQLTMTKLPLIKFLQICSLPFMRDFIKTASEHNLLMILEELDYISNLILQIL